MQSVKKSLDNILARNDYKRLTETLKERVKYIAKAIRLKMEELDIPKDDEHFFLGEIQVNKVKVAVKTIHSESFGDYNFLAIKRVSNDYNIPNTWASLEDIEHSYYYCGDFNKWVEGANNKEGLAFLNVAAEIIEGLGEVEKSQVAEINKALDNTKNF